MAGVHRDSLTQSEASLQKSFPKRLSKEKSDDYKFMAVSDLIFYLKKS